MANNLLSAKINVTAPNVDATFKKISVSVDSTVKSLSLLQKQVQAFGGGVRNFTNGFNTTIPAINGTNAALQKYSKTSSAATLATLNLGRVIQDAPFGFLGIANNLNPLLESFQRLRGTTGSAGGAIKAFGKSLIGPGGVGIALSLVSSALILFGDRLFGSSKAAKEAQEANEKLAQSISGDIVKLTSLAAIVQNVNANQNDRVKSLQAINEQYSKYLPSLDREKVTLDNIAISYDKIVDALLRQAVVKGLQEEVEKAVQKTAAAIIGLEREEAKRRIEQQKTIGVDKKQVDTIQDVGKIYQDLTRVKKDDFLASATAVQNTNAEIKAANKYDAVLKRLKDTLRQDLAPLFDIMKGFSFDDLDVTLKEDKGKTENIVARAKRIFEAYKDIIDLKLNILPEDEVKVQLQKAQVFLDKFFKQQFKFTVPIQVRIDEKDVIRPQEFIPAATTMAQMFGKEFNRYFEGGKFDPSIFNAMIDWAKDERVRQAGTDLAKSFSDSLTQGITGGLTAIGEGLGNILSGGDFGKGLLNVIGDLITQLGKALLAYGAIKQGIDKLLGPGGFAIPGGVAIGLGIAAIAIGQAFKNFGGFRAAGGPVEAGKAFVVGEKGAELFVPNTGGRIIPNNRMGNVSSMSGMSGGRVVFEIQGNKLIGVLANAGRYQSRNT